MKNKFLLILAGLILLVFLVVGTYMWYLYFLRMGNINQTNPSNTEIKSGDILFKDDGNGVNESNAKSITDNQVSDVPSYQFRVENTKNNKANYTLYIEDLPASLVADGCSDETLLTREQLKYQLVLNGEVIKEDYLSTILDNILDKREIEGKKTNSYALKIYIHENATDWYGKHFHYKVSLGK